MIKLGIIGTGYWGKHHLRIFSALPCDLVGIADIDSSKKKLAEDYGVAFFQDFKKLLKKVDAVSIVTPPATHSKIARKALMSGKHVLLEKPFVMKKEEAVELGKIANNKSLVLISGHTYLYHPAIVRIKEIIDAKELGNIYYFLFQWLNLGIIRRDVNALWNFAPHPFSILDYLLDILPVTISVHGQAFIQKGIEDVNFLSLKYSNGTIAQVNLSWLHPLKVREMAVVGSKKLVYFNDVDSETPLKIYDKGISPEEFQSSLDWKDFAQFKSKVRYGKVEMPKLTDLEPLKQQLEDFLTAIEGKKKPKASIDSIVRIVTLLEAAQKSLKKGGRIIEIKTNG